MKIPTNTIFLLFLALSAWGNDGVYLTRGGVIYPVNESNISLDREVLSFTVKDKTCRVDILFEFNNPDNTDRKLLIGFQAPMAYGDVSDAAKTNQISDFKIMSNGQIVPYTLKIAECENCALKDLANVNLSEAEFPAVFVYLFELTFKPGMNKINHSYTFPASINVQTSQFYNYILTTGSKWANGTIKDLTVQIDMGANSYFYVNDIFGSKADWAVVGAGIMAAGNQVNEHVPVRVVRVVRVLSGKLQIHVQAFKPLKNIEFGISRQLETDFLNTDDFSLDSSYSKEDLKLLRNRIYAQHGYVFKRKDLQDYFSQFDWYVPDPNLTMENIQMTEKEKKLIEAILQQEKE